MISPPPHQIPGPKGVKVAAKDLHVRLVHFVEHLLKEPVMPREVEQNVVVDDKVRQFLRQLVEFTGPQAVAARGPNYVLGKRQPVLVDRGGG